MFGELPLVEMPTTTSPFCDEGFDLPREHALVAVVVRDRRDRRGVHRERFRGQPAPLAQKAPAEFRREMLRVGRTAAVSHPQHLASGAESGRQRARDAVDDRLVAVSVEQTPSVVEHFAKGRRPPQSTVYGSIQNISSPSETSSPFSGRMRTHDARKIARDLVHHLHRFENAQHLPDLDAIADLDERLRTRRRRAIKDADDRGGHLLERSPAAVGAGRAAPGPPEPRRRRSLRRLGRAGALGRRTSSYVDAADAQPESSRGRTRARSRRACVRMPRVRSSYGLPHAVAV